MESVSLNSLNLHRLANRLLAEVQTLDFECEFLMRMLNMNSCLMKFLLIAKTMRALLKGYLTYLNSKEINSIFESLTKEKIKF